MCRSVTAWLFIERILLQQLLHSFGIAFSSYPSLSFIRSSLHIYGTKWSSVTFQINTNACSENLSDFLKWNMMVFVLTAAAAASSILCILLPRDDWWYAGEEHLILQPPAYCECVQFVFISKSNMNCLVFRIRRHAIQTPGGASNELKVGGALLKKRSARLPDCQVLPCLLDSVPVLAEYFNCMRANCIQPNPSALIWRDFKVVCVGNNLKMIVTRDGRRDHLSLMILPIPSRIFCSPQFKLGRWFL